MYSSHNYDHQWRAAQSGTHAASSTDDTDERVQLMLQMLAAQRESNFSGSANTSDSWQQQVISTAYEFQSQPQDQGADLPSFLLQYIGQGASTSGYDNLSNAREDEENAVYYYRRSEMEDSQDDNASGPKNCHDGGMSVVPTFGDNEAGCSALSHSDSLAVVDMEVEGVYEEKESICCCFCESKFESKRSLDEHLRDKHHLDMVLPERSPEDCYFHCPKCTAVFWESDVYQKHVYNKHCSGINGQMKFRCSLCTKPELFAKAKALLEHVKIIHRIEARRPQPMVDGRFKCPICTCIQVTPKLICAHFIKSHCLRAKSLPPPRVEQSTAPDFCYCCPRCVPEVQFPKQMKDAETGPKLLEHLAQVHGFHFQRNPSDGLIHCPFCTKAVNTHKKMDEHIHKVCCKKHLIRNRQKEQADKLAHQKRLEKRERRTALRHAISEATSMIQHQAKIEAKNRHYVNTWLQKQAEQLVQSQYSALHRQGKSFADVFDGAAALQGKLILKSGSSAVLPSIASSSGTADAI